MNKYILEENIDFYSELFKSLDDEEPENKCDETNNAKNSNICLITNEKLIDRYVKLNCGHSFNYVPLYNDLVNYKSKYNLMESVHKRLMNDEIRCPYCRNIQKGIIPYYEELNLPKINGVNYIQVFNPKQFRCCFKIMNLLYNEDIEESETNVKFLNCSSMYASKIILSDVNFDDDNIYCYEHKKMIIKKYKDDKKQKMKDEKLKIKEEKLAEKLKIKEEKLAEKLKIKEDKNKSTNKFVLLINNISDENYVLDDSMNDNVNTIFCVKILTKGVNKGKQCGQKICENNLCKRHSK